MARIATQEIRERAIAAYDAGQGSQHEVAAMFGIHVRTFQRWLQRYRTDGLCCPLQRGHRRAAFGGNLLAQLDQWVQRHSDATLEQLQERFLPMVKCSTVTIHNTLKRLDYRFKKSRYERVSRIDPT
jgi:transposase